MKVGCFSEDTVENQNDIHTTVIIVHSYAILMLWLSSTNFVNIKIRPLSHILTLAYKLVRLQYVCRVTQRIHLSHQMNVHRYIYGVGQF